MASSMERCPPEIVEQVVQHLEFNDVAQLRLTSRTMTILGTHRTFKERFLSQKVDLTRECLERFVSVTQDDGLACMIEELTIVAVAIDTSQLKKITHDEARWVTSSQGVLAHSKQHKCSPEELLQYRHELTELQLQHEDVTTLLRNGIAVNLLSTALSNIRKCHRQCQLRSVRLSVIVSLGTTRDFRRVPTEASRKWEPIWQAAADCFQTALRSMSQIHMSVEKLDVFNSLQRCSLGLDELDSCGTSAIANVLRDVKSLAISVSVNWQEASAIDASESPNGSPSTSVNKMGKVVSLLGLTPGLEELEIHFYRVRIPNDSEMHIWNEEAMASRDEGMNFPHLTRLTLRGLAMTAQSLIKLLRITRPKDVSLMAVHLKHDSFDPVFDYCTGEEAGLERIFFDDLFTDQMIYFPGVGQPKFPRLEIENGGSTLERTGADVRQAIQSRHPAGRMVGSPSGYRWRKIRTREYGPP